MVNFLKIKPYSIKSVHERSYKVSISQIPSLEDDNYRIYSAYLPESKRPAGYMRCRPTYVIKGNDYVKSLYISDLYSGSRGCGIGTALLDFAQDLSRENGCVGIHLMASGCYSPEKVPHLFYRKYGMNTGDKKLDKKMDKFIKRGKKATHMDFDNVVMYFPPVEYPKKNTIWRKLFRCINNIFATSKKCVAR